MKYRRLTNDGDYSFGNNALDFISGSEAIKQAIKTKLLLFYGEWWENISIGIPMFESIIGQYNQDNIKMSATVLITKRILEVSEVVSIQNVDIEFDKRNMTVSVEVKTTTGEILTEEVSI